jgi:putative spermidine/putrescine transport system ATP-binding protein
MSRSIPDGGEVALRLTDLEVRFGEAPGLAPISLEVRRGERLVLVGASGEGKTSLLRTIAGLAEPGRGRIEIGGVDVTGLAAERRGAVYLRQTPLLFPHLSVYENVAFPLRVRGVGGGEVHGRVRSALAAVHLADLAGRRPSGLSGGESQRAALARAIVARPALLLLDEPLSALDPALRDEVRRSIVQVVRDYQPGVVMVTHDLDEAGVLGDRIGVLIARRLEQLAPPDELFARPTSVAVARFLGFPNRVPGEVLDDGSFVAEGGLFRFACTAAAGAAVAVFRADALRIDAGGGIAGRVSALLHRAQGTAAQLVAGGIRLEVAVDPLALPRPGAELRLKLDPRRVIVFPFAGEAVGSV